ncbi:uncharacterized protein LOC8265154 [Ricinus communis]|jgi:hypothetical protein|uniref:Uncharacterized protein n=1 Tax=Ricinus communis TaxID=3988 RepID=B9RNH7_RICCO|nr:uncharacterized protein LOC8265154 [Ricinus communis]EEF47300.1 conserved hypothetical protein [Ricinus communis]|eukprot:XP_002515316.1 uncharacterized protein LOC8265154 [Ricinus communis]
MENNSSNIVVSSNTVTALDNNQKSHNGFVPKKKKRGPMHVFRVALYMIKSNKSKKSKSVSVGTVSIWKKLFGLGSMRPLQMPSDPLSPPLHLLEGGTTGTGVPPVLTRSVVEHLEVFTPPMSPAQASVASSSSCGMSQYASATNLQLLDEGDESDEDDQEVDINGDKGGDEMIDLKAEKFIAQFYQQMRLQDEAYATRCNRRMNGGQ